MLDFVVARALKKDPAVRYQNADELAADLDTCLAELRSGVPIAEPSEGSKTVKLDAAAERTVDAPAARAILVDTRLPFSRQFDSSAALMRIARKKEGRFGRVPRRVGLFRRLRRDAAMRRFVVLTVLGGIAGIYAALGLA